MEGCDDGNEEGCGEKLLSQLQKMGVENILVVVYVWHSGMAGTKSQEIYKNVIERAKDLLSILHQKVIEAEEQILNLKHERSTSSIKSLPSNARSDRFYPVLMQKTALENLMARPQLVTKVYPSNVIPDKLESEANNPRGVYRFNNFQNDPNYNFKQTVFAETNHEGEGQENEDLEVELTDDEFQYAVRMTEFSLRQLTKQHVINLKKQVKPHHLVEKVMNMVCILRGCVAPNWTTARDLMNSMTFKLELLLMEPQNLKQNLVKRVLVILRKHNKNLTPINLFQIDQGASILLTWVINLVKWNQGATKYHFTVKNLDTNGSIQFMPQESTQIKRTYVS